LERAYRVGEFAALTGVSVRTLHHYDQIGLLRPSSYSDGGHRLYSGADLLTVQQVLTLRYLGFPLQQIRDLLEREDFDLVASLRIQRAALQDRITELGKVAAVLNELLDWRTATGQWRWDLVAQLSSAVQGSMSQGGEHMDKMREMYTPEQMQQFAELREEIPAEEIAAIEQGWTVLMAEVRANRHLDPSSAEARTLAARWDEMTERTAAYYRAKPGLWQAIGENYQQNRFEANERAPQPEDLAFITRVKEAMGNG
jgi:MerR family transcriptional regulator, thiopeptide resistance regulator